MKNKNLHRQLKSANKKNAGWSLSFSFGAYGGFYFQKGFTIRFCLGWMAITYFPCDIDDLLSQIGQPIKTDVNSVDEMVRSLSDEKRMDLFDMICLVMPKRLKWDGIDNGATFFIDICRAYNAGKQNMIDVYNNGQDKAISSTDYFKKEFEIRN